ncbi:aldehyde dehydrogenase family protein [Acinetobacter qingfengensis]|uniref:aldehyde dehydrogenase (NAD(+)) n=1 Tax=Acinetobacter qingfengensis TaxID=1262585 RepID=A0A1E7R530_9GAMM|nr:aldehyde dehydrogenase family protein [Acinetobacter qingfengensis]KAA8732422.1 aldehyde dehydrogenase family protein [Acinetobacter qingfengensis]OEY94416.1 aldehyde dehydrogenase [Acinetobacter qingfengensis]
MSHNYINGHWQPVTGQQTIDIHNPATTHLLAKFTLASTDDVDQAVHAAKFALNNWKDTAIQQRADYLNKIAELITAKQQQLIELSHQNNGKPYYEAEIDVVDCIACFRYYAKLIQDYSFSELKQHDDNINTYLEKRPIGVVALITPWNFPLVTSAWKIAPALAAGCTIVFKPSEIVPLPELELAKIIDEAQLPNGVFNLILGQADTAQYLVKHPDVQKISFTGSTQVGIQVMQQAAITMKRTTLELGGKSPILIFADANIDDAVDKIIGGVFFNAGQMCSATTRLLVDKSIADQLFNKLKTAAETLQLGESPDHTYPMGPITTQKQYQKIHDYLTIAKQEGLQALLDQSVFQKPAQGYFITPHIFINVPSTSRLWNEEIFGPVLCCQTFEDEAHAIQIANDNAYGLAATIMIGDIEHGHQIAKYLNAGHIWINSMQIILPASSWGGFKMSGIGRELGESGLENYLENTITSYLRN